MCKNIVIILIFLFCFVSVNLYSQEMPQTYVSNNGIIITIPVAEKVSKEDVERIEKLNEEDAAFESERRSKKNQSDDITQVDDITQTDADFEDSDFEESDFDSMFSDASDVEKAVTTETTEIVKVDQKNKPIAFSGSLTAELGGYLWFKPREKTKPLATFSNTLSFVGRPTTDFFVLGSFRVSFPEMVWGVYELYFNYTLFGLVDLAAGKRDVSWSLSRMLDTNILDDEASKITNPEEVFNKKERTANDSKFFVTINVPIFSYASIQGLAYYFPYTNDIVIGNIAIAGKIEGSIGKFSLGVFGMKWPENDSNRLNPVLGGQIVSSILGKQSNLFVHGMFHIEPSSEKNFNRAKLTAGVYKYFPNPVMLGLAFEYQGIWDEDDTAFGTDENFQHYFAAQLSWSRFIFTKKWTFGVEWFHDKGRDYGTVLPVMKIEDIIKYTDFRVAVPIYYGSEKKYGLVFELVVNLNY